MRRLAKVACEIVALLAMLADLLIVGPLSLLALALSVPPGADVGGLALKTIVVVSPPRPPPWSVRSSRSRASSRLSARRRLAGPIVDPFAPQQGGG